MKKRNKLVIKTCICSVCRAERDVARDILRDKVEGHVKTMHCHKCNKEVPFIEKGEFELCQEVL